MSTHNTLRLPTLGGTPASLSISRRPSVTYAPSHTSQSRSSPQAPISTGQGGKEQTTSINEMSKDIAKHTTLGNAKREEASPAALSGQRAAVRASSHSVSLTLPSLGQACVDRHGVRECHSATDDGPRPTEGRGGHPPSPPSVLRSACPTCLPASLSLSCSPACPLENSGTFTILLTKCTNTLLAPATRATIDSPINDIKQQPCRPLPLLRKTHTRTHTHTLHSSTQVGLNPSFSKNVIKLTKTAAVSPKPQAPGRAVQQLQE
ncbi:hypothetical protein E2C01_073984 [Portunus trituberculatus]|uniref:Uncharacterized protein n=1 Tax=Portunus trituberculatus TaxID=210409 RepID=A0A5B7IB69_PORTR|nr:hypothetical protein [Portunus trituberculatus]